MGPGRRRYFQSTRGVFYLLVDYEGFTTTVKDNQRK